MSLGLEQQALALTLSFKLSSVGTSSLRERISKNIVSRVDVVAPKPSIVTATYQSPFPLKICVKSCKLDKIIQKFVIRVSR